MADPPKPRGPCDFRDPWAPWDACGPRDPCEVRLRDRWAAEAERLLAEAERLLAEAERLLAEAERLLGRRRAVLALDGDRLEVAVVLAVCRAAGVLRAELLLVVGLAALDREAVAAESRAARLDREAVAPESRAARLDREAGAPESRAARVVAAREPPLWVVREPLLCDPLGLAPFRRDRLDADRRLPELLDVVEGSAMTLLGYSKL